VFTIFYENKYAVFWSFFTGNAVVSPKHLLNSESPRKGFLVEMYTAEESTFNQTLMSYRLGAYKLIRGMVRDSNYYAESSGAFLNCSHPTYSSKLIELTIEAMDYLFGKGPSDTLNIMLGHMFLHDLLSITDHKPEPVLALYNIDEDPCERNNLAADPALAGVVREIDAELERIIATRAHSLHMELQLDISLGHDWAKTHVPGDCSTNPNIKPEHCRFTHSWVPDVRRLLFQVSFHCSALFCFVLFCFVLFCFVLFFCFETLCCLYTMCIIGTLASLLPIYNFANSTLRCWYLVLPNVAGRE
jgi:hypothetical protein